jgi:hypothetical protein
MVLENITDYSKQSRHHRGVSLYRADSDKGYTLDNVRLTTTIFNSAQNNWSLADLLAAAISIAKLHGYKVIPPEPIASLESSQLQFACTPLEV